jgi:hypothetical protein
VQAAAVDHLPAAPGRAPIPRCGSPLNADVHALAVVIDHGADFEWYHVGSCRFSPELEVCAKPYGLLRDICIFPELVPRTQCRALLPGPGRGQGRRRRLHLNGLDHDVDAAAPRAAAVSALLTPQGKIT